MRFAAFFPCGRLSWLSYFFALVHHPADYATCSAIAESVLANYSNNIMISRLPQKRRDRVYIYIHQRMRRDARLNTYSYTYMYQK